jgi:hypothetical protein
MTSPFPYRLGAPLVVDETFDGMFSNGWVEDTDIVSPSIWGANGAFAVSDFAASPPTHFDEAVKTFSGFTPNGLVTFAIGLDWNLGVGAPGGPTPVDGLFFGATVGGVQGALSGPFYFVDNPGTIWVRAFTNSSGEVEVRVGATGMVGSFDIQAQFNTIRAWDGEPDVLEDIIIDSAILYHEDTVPISITRGGATFDAAEEYEEYDFPGKTGPVVGGEEVAGMRPVIRASAMLTGERQFEIYRPSGTWANSSYGRTYTPGAMRETVGSGVYLTNVRCIWKRARGDFVQVRFPKALCRRYGIGGEDRDEGQLPLEIEARQDLSSGTPGSVPLYYIDILPVGATL